MKCTGKSVFFILISFLFAFSSVSAVCTYVDPSTYVYVGTCTNTWLTYECGTESTCDSWVPYTWTIDSGTYSTCWDTGSSWTTCSSWNTGSSWTTCSSWDTSSCWNTCSSWGSSTSYNSWFSSNCWDSCNTWPTGTCWNTGSSWTTGTCWNTGSSWNTCSTWMSPNLWSSSNYCGNYRTWPVCFPPAWTTTTTYPCGELNYNPGYTNGICTCADYGTCGCEVYDTCCEVGCYEDQINSQEYYCYNDNLNYQVNYSICSAPGECGSTLSDEETSSNYFIDTCSSGCCVDGQGSCSAPIYNESEDCPSIKESYCVGNQRWTRSYEGVFTGDSSCNLTHSCVVSFTPVEELNETCSFGCSSLGSDAECLKRYCLDSDSDGFGDIGTCINTTEDNAPANYVPLGDITTHQYLLNSSLVNYSSANLSCIAKGGSLVVVDSSDEQSLLNTRYLGNEYWIGLDDRVTEDVFVWNNGQEESVYFNNWPEDGSEPNDNWLVGGEDCVVSNSLGVWNDVKCSGQKKYVCEFLPEVEYRFDCKDSDNEINPNAIEVCDGEDNDCDGLVDESKSCQAVTDVRWVNLRGDAIFSSDYADTVLMSTEGVNLALVDLTYRVQTEGFIGANTIYTTTTYGKELVSYLIDSTKTPLWFLVNSSSGYENQSNNLVVATKENNKIPSAIITGPSKALNTSVGTIIDFNATVYDTDDFLKVTWDFGDGITKTFDNYASAIDGSSSLNVNHSFNSCGVFRVKLIAEEKERGQVNESYVDIYVYNEGVCVFPVVSSPIQGRTDYGQLIRFDANKSFVTNCSSGLIEDVDFTIGNLNCSYIHAPGQEVVGEDYNLSVEWKIDSRPPIKGSWGQESASGKIQNFLRYFSEPNYHITKLNLIYEK